VATARRSPTGFVNIPGNGLDAFEAEISTPPPAPVSDSPLLEIVAAYPEPELCPAAWRVPARPPFSFRRLVTATLSAARAVALFPFVILSWFILRIWWLILLVLSGAWRAITETVQLIADAFAATGRGIRDVILGAVRLARATVRTMWNTVVIAPIRLLIGAVTAGARAARTSLYAIGRAVARGAVAVRSASVASVRATLDGIVFAGTLIARSAAAGAALARTILRAMWNTVVIAPIRLLIGTVTAGARAARDSIYGIGRAVARGAVAVRSASVASVRGTLDGIALARTLIARSAAVGAHVLHRGSRAAGSGAALALDIIRAAFASLAHRVREAGDRLAAGLRHDAPRVVRMAIAGIPLWTRQPRLVPVIAALLTVTAGISVAFAMLLLTQRDVQRVAAPAPSAPVLAAAAPSIVTAVMQSAPAPTTRERPAKRRDDPVTPPETKASLSPERVRDLWSKTDTRSLDRALTSLRSTTLAFQRCEMRVADDRAVAHCDEAGPGSAAMRVAWTIDFRRDDGRWLIDSLSSARPARLNR